MTEAMFHVLVVEDDAGLRTVLQTLLIAEGHRVSFADTAARALLDARHYRPDMVLLDLGLPDRDGQTLIPQIRSFSAVPLLVLSARDQESERVAALDAGADDYVTKPFGAGELLARMRAILRRKVSVDVAGGPVEVGLLRVDFGLRRAEGPTGPVHLTPLEYRLLERLVLGRGAIVTRDALVREVWGTGHPGESSALRVYIKSLRDKLEPDPARPRHLITEAGVGYRLEAPGETRA
jgi:two-component system KDP operon response regulator KdpE